MPGKQGQRAARKSTTARQRKLESVGELGAYPVPPGIELTDDEHIVYQSWASARLPEDWSEPELRMLADAAYRLPQLTSAIVPDGIDEGAARSRLLTEHGIEIGAVW